MKPGYPKRDYINPFVFNWDVHSRKSTTNEGITVDTEFSIARPTHFFVPDNSLNPEMKDRIIEWIHYIPEARIDFNISEDRSLALEGWTE